MRKRIRVALLALAMLVCLNACSTDEAEQSAASETEQTLLPENGDTITYIMEARMVSDYNSEPAFDSENETTAPTFWKTLAYLVSDYGTQNEKVSQDESTHAFSVPLKQVQYYASALYGELGKVKKLPALSDSVSGVTKASRKEYQFEAMDTDGYAVDIHSCAKDSTGAYKIYAALVDSAGKILQEYRFTVKESVFGAKKTSFSYSVVSQARLAEFDGEKVLVGERETALVYTQDGSPEEDTQGNAGAEGEGTEPSSAGGLAADGTETTGAAGAISSGSALEQAQSYYGTADPESGEEYVYTYEGVTTFNQASYYSFSVSSGESYVMHILVSDDGSRILKGTKNEDGTWNIQ